MAAPKGHKKWGGKKKGDKNKKTLEWEQFGKQLLEMGLPRAMAIMQTCKEREFMNYFTGLLEYFKPKLARTEHTGKDGKDLIPPVSDNQKKQLSNVWKSTTAQSTQQGDKA